MFCLLPRVLGPGLSYYGHCLGPLVCGLIEELEAQIDSGDAAILSRVTHDLIGFGGLYGLHQMRYLVTDYRKQYGRLCADDRLDRLRQLRRYLDRYFSGGESR